MQPHPICKLSHGPLPTPLFRKLNLLHMCFDSSSSYVHAGGADVSQAGDVADPFAKDPPRHPALITRTAKPFNGETPGVLLHTVDIPTDLFYVRNHLPVPEVDAESYK